MRAKRILQCIFVVVFLVATLASTGSASAWTSCASYVTVQWGDTLSGIAAACGTSVEAIRAANPGLGWWLYAGQVLYIPSGNATMPGPYYPGQTGRSYTVQWGDSLGGIAMVYGISLQSLLAVNPQIGNASLIFPGQVISLPASAGTQPNTGYPGTTYPPATNGQLTITYPGGNTGSTYPYPSYPGAYSTPIPSSLFANLKVTVPHGLLVRTGPGVGFPEIKSQYVSAVQGSTWSYRKASLTIDSTQFAWIEVQLTSLSGYSVGWILVRDSIGNYFTNPHLGPFIDPNDP